MFLNILLTVVKNYRLQNVLKETKSHIFLFVYLLQIQFLSVFCQPTTRRYSSAHVNDLELTTCERIVKYFVMFSFQIFLQKTLE